MGKIPGVYPMQGSDRPDKPHRGVLGRQGVYICLLAYSPLKVDRIWGIWGSYRNIAKAIFYLLKGDYRV